MSKRNCARQASESENERRDRLDQDARETATSRAAEIHEQIQQRRARDAGCHRNSRHGTATTDDGAAQRDPLLLDGNTESLGSDAQSVHEPEWKMWYTDEYKQKVRDNLNRFHE